jgi:hypothetical protein
MVKSTRVLEATVHAKIPEKCMHDFIKSVADKEKITLYGQIDFTQAAYLYAYHLITAEGYCTLEKKFGFPHANCNQVFGTIRRYWEKWSMEQVAAGTLAERKRAAQNFVKFKEFKDSTLVVDSADFQLEKRDRLKAKSPWWSKKEKHHAARYQFFISQDSLIRY